MLSAALWIVTRDYSRVTDKYVPRCQASSAPGLRICQAAVSSPDTINVYFSFPRFYRTIHWSVFIICCRNRAHFNGLCQVQRETFTRSWVSRTVHGFFIVGTHYSIDRTLNNILKGWSYIIIQICRLLRVIHFSDRQWFPRFICAVFHLASGLVCLCVPYHLSWRARLWRVSYRLFLLLLDRDRMSVGIVIRAPWQISFE